MAGNKENVSVIIAIVGFIIVLVVGYFMFTASKKPEQKISSESAMSQNSESIDQNNNSYSYSGKVLAGRTTPYIDFNQSDYEKALRENKTIVLSYYANWCPICRGEAPILEGGFNGLDNPDIVGFRINFNDPETDDYEKKLAEEHGVSYQHTKVILKNGVVVLKDGNVWDSETFKEKINSVL